MSDKRSSNEFRLNPFMRVNRDKQRFIQDGVIRVMPEPERLDALIDKLEKLWDGLTVRGYGHAMRAEAELQRKAEAETASFPPAPVDAATRRRQELESDLRHWQRLANVRPNDEQIIGNLRQAERRLREHDAGGQP